MAPGKDKITVAILTLSTSRSNRDIPDGSGQVLFDDCRANGMEVVDRRIVADDRKKISRLLKYFSDVLKTDLVLTTGGTGLGPLDVTPEATHDVIEKIIPGISEHIRIQGLKKTKMSVLSRGISGIRKNTLIINLPGSPAGAAESLKAIIGIVPHALLMMKGGGH